MISCLRKEEYRKFTKDDKSGKFTVKMDKYQRRAFQLIVSKFVHSYVEEAQH